LRAGKITYIKSFEKKFLLLDENYNKSVPKSKSGMATEQTAIRINPLMDIVFNYYPYDKHLISITLSDNFGIDVPDFLRHALLDFEVFYDELIAFHPKRNFDSKNDFNKVIDSYINKLNKKIKKRLVFMESSVLTRIQTRNIRVLKELLNDKNAIEYVKTLELSESDYRWLYEITGKSEYLPQIIQDIFIF